MSYLATLGLACQAAGGVEGRVLDAGDAARAPRGVFTGVRLSRPGLAESPALTRACEEHGRLAALRSRLDSVTALAPDDAGPEARAPRDVRRRAYEDSIALLRARYGAALGVALRDSLVSSAQASLTGQFAIYGIIPGDYLLWARAPVGGEEYLWAEGVTVGAGRQTRKDLTRGASIFDHSPCEVLSRARTAVRP